MANSESEWASGYVTSQDAAKHFKKLTECDQADGHEDDNAEWKRIASDPHTETNQDHQQCDTD
jgi:hypothetical protein